MSGDKPGVIAPPPVIFLVPLLIGVYLSRRFSVPFLRHDVAVPAGVALTALAVAMAFLAIRTFHRAGTNVNPQKPATTLVTSGPYRFTRNPMYVNLTLFYVGVSIWSNALWPLFFLPVILAITGWGVIAREERYLEAKFGDEYRQYKTRVRRWV